MQAQWIKLSFETSQQKLVGKTQNFLVDESFKQSKSDYCLYVRKEPGKTVYVLVWVDDLLVASTSLEIIQGRKKNVLKNFEMEEKGELRRFFDIRIKKRPGRISLDQEQYIELYLL